MLKNSTIYRIEIAKFLGALFTHTFYSQRAVQTSAMKMNYFENFMKE